MNCKNVKIYTFSNVSGKIETYRKEWATEGERMPIVRHKENLKFEGQFTQSTRNDQKWVPGDRAPIIRRTDNLKPSEGVFEKRKVEQWAPGDRSDIVGKYGE